MQYRVEVAPRAGTPDARGEALAQQAQALGVEQIDTLRVIDLYFLEGELGEGELERLTASLLVDPVVEQARWLEMDQHSSSSSACKWSVEVALQAGVTDSVASNLLDAARTVGVESLRRAATGQRYEITGAIDRSAVERLARGLLANEVIQRFAVNQPVTPPRLGDHGAVEAVEDVPLIAADDDELLEISARRRLSMVLEEMRALQAYFKQEGREPTDLELEMLAQTWSEHCVHKTFRARVEYEELAADGSPLPEERRTVDSMLRTYIRGATEHAAKPWVHSAFVDNAGIVAFDDELDLAFKVETHNHPSALEPFGGANTGVGGVVRDVMGVSARPIATTDVLCFGPPDTSFEELPDGLLHPRRIADGVIAGVEDYGNKMGIPTVSGAVLYHPGYIANPLVFCGCLGLLPRGAHPTSPRPGDMVVVIGGRTGRDGLRGATFSSLEMDADTSSVAGSAVQIGHPINEKQALEVLLRARDERLYTAVTDCGAGGLSSAVGEMARELGADIQLQHVPLKYPGLRPWEIWLSEAQERMVFAVPTESWPRLQQLCAEHDAEATSLGTFTGDGRLTVRFGARVVGALDMGFLHDGLPRRSMRAVWRRPALVEPEPSPQRDLLAPLLALLATPDLRSKEDVVRRYDHEVQGGTVVKPLVGPSGQGPGDASVLVPLETLRRTRTGAQPCPGVALSVGVNPRFGALDPYAMAWAAVDEAMRNCVAVGADPDRVALLDNFCWGNPALPDRLGGLLRCARGCYDAAIAFNAPFVSGKDSLNNEYSDAAGGKHAIPGTLLISAIGVVPDVARTATMDLKGAGDLLYVVGETADELGGSAYYHHLGVLGASIPRPPSRPLELLRALHQAIRAGCVRACHDCSEGGLAVAAAEMSIAGELGLSLRLADVPTRGALDHGHAIAFSESLCRFVVEVSREAAPELERHLAGFPVACVGEVRDDDAFNIRGVDAELLIATDLASLRTAWRGHLQR